MLTFKIVVDGEETLIPDITSLDDARLRELARLSENTEVIVHAPADPEPLKRRLKEIQKGIWEGSDDGPTSTITNKQLVALKMAIADCGFPVTFTSRLKRVTTGRSRMTFLWQICEMDEDEFGIYCGALTYPGSRKNFKLVKTFLKSHGLSLDMREKLVGIRHLLPDP